MIKEIKTKKSFIYHVMIRYGNQEQDYLKTVSVVAPERDYARVIAVRMWPTKNIISVKTL